MTEEFINNKYTKIYYQIVSKATSRSLDASIYSEKHHVIPRSLGGIDDNTNIVVLTAREHFICHWLLTKMTSDDDKKKMVYAHWRMVNTKNSNRYNVTSKIYEFAKLEFDKLNRGRIVSDVTRQKQKAPKSQEHKEKLKLYSGIKHHGFGKKRPNHGQCIAGDKNPMKNLNVIEKVSGNNHWSRNPKNRRICEHCQMDIDKSNYKMYHGDNCKERLDV